MGGIESWMLPFLVWILRSAQLISIKKDNEQNGQMDFDTKKWRKQFGLLNNEVVSYWREQQHSEISQVHLQ